MLGNWTLSNKQIEEVQLWDEPEILVSLDLGYPGCWDDRGHN
jgi:hypothetical protein